MHLSVINPSTCTCTTVLYFNEVHLLVSVFKKMSSVKKVY